MCPHDILVTFLILFTIELQNICETNGTRESLKRQEIPTHDKIIESLSSAGLIIPTKRCQYKAKFFTVPKPGKKVRPVFDYSLLNPHIQPPKFLLPNLFQLVNRDTWPKNKYYVKLDIKQCFFNIPIHPGR
jgi:hypothetical protein